MQRNNPDPSSFSVESNFADSMTQLNRLKTLKAAADDESNIPELVASLTRMATSLIRGKMRRGIVEQFISKYVGKEWVDSILADATAMAKL